MLKFYYSAAPNPTKIALFLEEAGLPYEAIPVDTRKGEQHKPEYLAINPNAKVPAIVDGDAVVFDLERDPALSRREDRKIPAGEKTDKARGELLSWLLFVASGVGPFSGQSVHFRNYAPEKLPYAINRYMFEAQRHFGILDARLAKQKIHAGRHLHHRRHGRLGLGAAHAERARARAPGTSSRTSSAWSTRSARGRPRRRRSRSRTGTSSRPRWTTRRSTPCSRT